MNRTIKYRAQSKFGRHDWLYGSLLQLNGKAYIFPEESSVWNMTKYEAIADTVGQFIGSLDKSGGEVFEGDIIRVSAYVNKGQCETYDFRDLFTVEDLKGFLRYDFISDIKFNEGGFYLSEYSEWDTSICVLFGDMRHSFPIFECEVIGNIHDNPELLKGE